MTDQREFTLTAAHLLLLRHMHWEWNHCETGAPSVNPKRPYGNSSVARDIADLFSWAWPDEETLDCAEFDAAVELVDGRCMAIHAETKTALELVSGRAGLASPAGRYVNIAPEYHSPCWELQS